MWKMNVFKRKLCSSRCAFYFGLFLITFFNCDLVSGEVKRKQNVSLIVEPPAVRRAQHVTLKCLYNLSSPLYSVKFYRGNLEFFRFTPGERPEGKVFPYPGFSVDKTESNATQVVLRNVGFALTGSFSCEVTADAPSFSTGTAYGFLQVVEYPEQRPMLFTEHSRYEPGDVLRANCSTLPSRPKAELKFTINNMVVSSQETQYIPGNDDLIASRQSLKLHLQSIHFQSPIPMSQLNSIYADPRPTGALVLRCTAQIGNLYQEFREINLGVPQRDPVPARVTHSSAASLQDFFNYFSSSSSPSRFSSLESRLMTISFTVALIGAFHWLQFHTR